jgi:hypothetical protein
VISSSSTVDIADFTVISGSSTVDMANFTVIVPLVTVRRFPHRTSRALSKKRVNSLRL